MPRTMQRNPLVSPDKIDRGTHDSTRPTFAQVPVVTDLNQLLLSSDAIAAAMVAIGRSASVGGLIVFGTTTSLFSKIGE